MEEAKAKYMLAQKLLKIPQQMYKNFVRKHGEEMNNEPVAWMLVDEINGDYMLERNPSGDYDWIPLYTHPVKELDGDVIDALINDMPESPTNDELYEFANRVLRKAQEK